MFAMRPLFNRDYTWIGDLVLKCPGSPGAYNMDSTETSQGKFIDILGTYCFPQAFKSCSLGGFNGSVVY